MYPTLKFVVWTAGVKDVDDLILVSWRASKEKSGVGRGEECKVLLSLLKQIGKMEILVPFPSLSKNQMYFSTEKVKEPPTFLEPISLD